MSDKAGSEPFERPPGASPGGSGSGAPAPRPATGEPARQGDPGASGGSQAAGPKRSSAEIRSDIENQREQLGQSVDHLRDRVNDLTDWRGQLRKHRKAIVVGAVATGFVAGGLMALRRR